ncbi:protein transport protein Sec24-like At3g07100 [Thunnus albacares]|uniref:protein transport protein Sec24-like At3g07100 n=1 Tax=Thunnus albacares TaxID=8236 RepID=UPI001CF6C765|nr:protein transport protein Sec24-like At3g07100 [Thunnus albacares]
MSCDGFGRPDILPKLRSDLHTWSSRNLREIQHLSWLRRSREVPKLSTEVSCSSVPPFRSFTGGCTTTASSAVSFQPSSYSNTRPGLPPSSHVLLPSVTRHATRPSYPQHPAPAPGFLPHQPFQPQPVPIGGPSAFPPPDPSMLAANLSGPLLQPLSSILGGMPPMPSNSLKFCFNNIQAFTGETSQDLAVVVYFPTAHFCIKWGL